MTDGVILRSETTKNLNFEFPIHQIRLCFAKQNTTTFYYDYTPLNPLLIEGKHNNLPSKKRGRGCVNIKLWFTQSKTNNFKIPKRQTRPSATTQITNIPLPRWEGLGEGDQPFPFNPHLNLPHQGGGTRCLNFPIHQNRLLCSRPQWQLKIQLFGQPQVSTKPCFTHRRSFAD